MNTQSNAMPDFPRDPHASAPLAMSETRPLYWSIQRELWENRSIYIAPLIAGGVYLLGYTISLLWLPRMMREWAELDPMQQRMKLAEPYAHAGMLVALVAFIVGIFYSLDALHGERRDRSILFWKSLPVSDLMAVLSKAAVPIVILPLLAFAITVLTQWMMLLISSAVLLGSGQNEAILWSRVGIFHRAPMLLFHFLCIHGLWQSPIYAWLLLVSGWARRIPILWATLPPLTIGIVEKVAFNTTYFGSLIGNRFTGGSEGAAIMEHGRAMDTMMLIEPLHFLLNPGLWVGLAVTAAFLAAAVHLRRYRGPI